MTTEPTPSTVFTLSYHVERREIWNWYWFYWSRPNGLWRVWAAWFLFLLSLAWNISLATHTAFEDVIKIALLIYCLCIAFFVIFPQIAYKPSNRTMTVDARGISSSRAGMAANRSWKDISLIEFRTGYTALIVAGSSRLWPFPVWLRTRTGNAFIISDRAFADTASKGAFRNAILSWHDIQKLRFPRLAPSRYYE